MDALYRLAIGVIVLTQVGGVKWKRRTENFPTTAIPEQTSKTTNSCRLTLQPGCTCTNHTKSTLNVFCNRAGFTKLPALEFGAEPIHTLSFVQNKISNIQTGDFFGLKVDRLLLGNNSISELNLLSFWGLEYHLIALDLSYNRLTRIPSDALRLLRNLRSLNVVGNMIRVLENNDFLYLTKLEVVSLDRNPLTLIQDDAFIGTNLLLLTADAVNLTLGLLGIPAKDLQHLKGLSIAANDMHDLNAGWFDAFPALTSLNLDDNDLRELVAGTFSGLEDTLRTLQLNYNKLKKIPTEAIQSLEKLETLELSKNHIKKIYARSFNSSKQLVTLNLRSNAISDIDPFAFENMPNLEEVDLRDNELITLDQYTFFYPGSRVRQVWLENNRWLCNCLLQWLRKEYKKRTAKAAVFVDVDEVRCERPEFLHRRPLVRVPRRDLTCDHDYYYYYDEYEQPIY